MQLTILDIGHGNSAILQDGASTVIIDAGPKTGLLEHLDEHGIKTIDLILLSHSDEDHIAGLLALIYTEEFQIKAIRLNTDSLKGSKLWGDLLFQIHVLQERGELDFNSSLSTADSGRFMYEETNIEILAPTTYLTARGPGSTDQNGRRIETNSISAVIRIVNRGDPIALLPGDLDELGLEHLAARSIDAQAPILIFPHHGGRSGRSSNIENFTQQLAEIVNPKTVIFSFRRGSDYPLPGIIQVIKHYLPETRIICTQLSEQCASSIPNFEPDHLLPIFSSGRPLKHCCGGSIVVSTGDSVAIRPSAESHERFISIAAPTALCGIRRVLASD
jgi:beta-lactamase superfamily II metal-dependent hydrolase